MADDKERAEKLAAARKKAQKKAAEAKAKKGKAAAPKKEEVTTSANEPTAESATTDEPKEEPAPPAEEDAPVTSPPPEPETAAPVEEPAPAAPTEDPASSEATAALEARLAALEKDHAAAQSARDEAQLLADALEKKVASLEALHREDEGAIKRLETDLAAARTEAGDLRDKLTQTELKLSKKEAQDGGGTDNDHLDELEDEERRKLEGRIRELEAENAELQRGIWQEKRRVLQPSMEEAAGGGQFTNVDLGAMSPGAQRKAAGGLGDFFTSGLNALTGQGQQQGYPHAHGGQEHDEDGFLDDDEDFDEEAFRKAQEEAAKARIERIKEVKRGLKNWENWRLDLVEGRRGGGEGIGEIFEV